MTSTQQRAALKRQIWQIANDVRGIRKFSVLNRQRVQAPGKY